MGHYKQGIYKIKHPEKYLGRTDTITYRSSWEFKVMKYLDDHPEVEKWASEEPWFIVPYRCPISGKLRRYFPDIWFKKVDKNGKVTKFMVEIKPYEQTIPPKPSKTKSGKSTISYQKKMYTYAINSAKFKAARELCQRKSWEFIILTERQINSL
jgi:hypothetical protein